MQLCSYLSHEHAEVDFQVQPWRFDLLEYPDWAASASADSLKADLFVVAASHGSDLPVHVRNWVSSCLQKRGGGGALVALLGAERRVDPDDSPRLRFLQNAARDAGLDFFAPMPQFEPAVLWDTQVTKSPFGAQNRTGPKTILHPTTDHRHWGIND